MATSDKALGKRKATLPNPNAPSHLQVRAALDAHYTQYPIGRELVASEIAVQQSKRMELATPPRPAMAPPPKATLAIGDAEREKRAHIGNYYKHHFPYEQVHRLFSRAWVEDGPEAHKREYGWEGIGGSPFVRWKSCSTPKALHDMVCGTDCGKLNVGAMFNADPANRYKEKCMVPTRREFVIDIDLDDYGGISKDDLRACDRNWPLVAVGLEVVTRVLHTAFGFEHILPVYSGRRGGHLWVCDERACCMNDEARIAVTNFLSPSEGKGKKWWMDLVKHPNFQEISANLMVPFFRTVGIQPLEQRGLGIFEMSFQRKNFLAYMHESIGKHIETDMCAADTPTAALDIVEAYCNDGAWKWEQFQAAIWECIGPRIDANVSKHANHTLKSPYSVHPKTGRVSVPIVHDRLDQFPVAARAPFVRDLTGNHVNVSKDTLARSVEAFSRFIDKVAASETEKWKAATSSPEPKRQKTEVVHDMTGPSTPEDTEPVLADYPRPAIKLERTWTVRRSKLPDMVSLYTNVRGSVSNMVTIKAGKYPPFENEYDQGNVDTITTQIARAVGEAQDHDYALHGGSKSFIMVFNQGERDCTNPKTHEYASKICLRLQDEVKVADLNLKWGEDSLESFIRQKISPLVTDLYSPRPPRPPHDSS